MVHELMMLCVLALLVAQLYVLMQIHAKLDGPSEDSEQSAEPVRERRALDPMDEGVENILTFSVRGKTGFESLDEE